MAIPTIDLTPFFDGTAAERDAVARQVDEAGRHLGFMRFAGHGFPIDLTARCVAAAQDFFAKPAAFKRRYGPAKDGDFNGYWGPESELSGALFGSKTNFDLKEKFKISRPTDTGEYDPAQPKIGWEYQPNRLPADPADFAPTFLAYYAAMEATGKRVMRVMAAALGMNAEWFDDKIDKQESTATWNHYPPQPQGSKEGQFRSSPHRDIGSITILIEGIGQGLASGGLEIMDEHGKWLDARYEPGTIMVNVGDLLRRWTNNRWTSSLHRVANPPDAASAAKGRVSLAFFQKPNFHAALAAVPSCVAPGAAPVYPPMPAGEYMRYRMLHSVGVLENVESVFEAGLMAAPDPAYGRKLEPQQQA